MISTNFAQTNYSNKPTSMKKLLLRLSALVLMVCFTMNLSAQGETTASMSGTVSDSNGESVIGATVLATHTPSGVTYGTVSDALGYYQIPNMRVGGPYTLAISYVGYSDVNVEGIILRLGEKRRQNYIMNEGGVTLDEVAIVAQAGSIGLNSGASTSIEQEDILKMPTLNRDFNDFTRLTPQSRQTFGGGVSIAGMNNRYNAIYIDGAVNNDVFGLADNGTNGGQTGIAPFSIDAIDQIQVVVSPYDVTYGGFAGGGINAVTKSGTNQIQGSAYYFLQNESLAGKTNGTIIERAGGSDDDRESLDEFTNSLIGFSVGGPIIKDKAFFFVNAEFQNDETPRPFAISQYEGDTDEAGLNSLRNFLQETYNYDAGEFGDKIGKLEGTRLFAKVDYKLNDDHSLTLRHNYTKGEQLNQFSSTNSRINFGNNGINFPTTTNSTGIELKSNFGTNMSNKLIVGYTTVRDDRDPIGDPFPNVFILDGEGAISFGSEAFSTANALDQNVLTITDNFKMYKGDHTITIGTHNEFISFYNLFIRQNFGSYFFLSLDDFYNGNVTGFDRSYSLVDNVTGDGSAAAAEFDAAQFGFYIQDEWAVNNQLTLTGGLRLDIPMLSTDPNIDPSFNTTTLPALANSYDLQGAEGGSAPSGQLMFSPRLGFDYQLNNTTAIRGGLGVFTSRVPFVWPGGMYTNNGLTIGGLDEGDLDEVTFIGDAFGQPENPNFTVPSGQVDLFADDFKYPQVFRASLGVDKTFGDGWRTSIEGIYTKTLNNVFYQNVNSDPTVDFNWTNGGDDRPIFTRGRIDDTYTAVYLASNTNEGYSYNMTASVEKDFSNGLSAFAAYSVGDAEAIFEGTSSQNSSQWRGAFTVDGRNNAEIGRSDFALGNRLIAGAGYTQDWTGDGNFNTSISVFYNGQSGELYSYVYDTRNINNESGSTSRERHLIYVPADQNDILLIDDGDVTAAEQWTALNTFIEEDDYLSGRRGQYAEKNSNRTPFTHTIDLRISQDIGANVGGNGNRLQLSLDIFNFGNMINKNWGVVYSNPFAYRILNYEGLAADGTTPQFTFSESDLGDDRFGISDRPSRWRGRIGLRYTFN